MGWLLGKRSHRPFFRAVGAVSVVRLTGGLLLFLSQIALARWMGVQAFGVYSYAWAWVAVLGTLAGLGLPGTSVRFLATYRAQGEHARVRGLLRFGRLLTLMASVLIGACAMALVELLIPDSPYNDALQAAFLGVPLLAFLSLEAAYARGFNWMALSAVAEQIGRPTALLVLGWLVWKLGITSGATARDYVRACVLAYLIAAAAQSAIVRTRIRAATGAGRSELEVRLWMQVSAGMLLLSGAQMLRTNAELLLVGALLSPADVGIYTAAVRTATLVSFVMTVTSAVAQPGLASMHAENRRAELAGFVAAATRSIFVTSLLIGAVLAIAGPFVLARFGPEFTAGYTALLILIAGHVLVAGSGPLTSLLIMTGHQMPAAALHGLSVLSSIALNSLLIPGFGIEGAALASGLNSLLTQVALAVLVRRRLDLPLTVFGLRRRADV